MNVVQRILAKVVGDDISEKEMELVTGGAMDPCIIYHSEQAYGWCDDIPEPPPPG